MSARLCAARAASPARMVAATALAESSSISVAMIVSTASPCTRASAISMLPTIRLPFVYSSTAAMPLCQKASAASAMSRAASGAKAANGSRLVSNRSRAASARRSERVSRLTDSSVSQ